MTQTITSLVAIKGNKCSIFRIFEESDCYPLAHFIIGVSLSHLRFSHRVIIMNFSEDRDARILLLYLFTKFELDQFTNNRDLLSDRGNWKHRHIHTEIETDTLPIYHIETSKKNTLFEASAEA